MMTMMKATIISTTICSQNFNLDELLQLFELLVAWVFPLNNVETWTLDFLALASSFKNQILILGLLYRKANLNEENLIGKG